MASDSHNTRLGGVKQELQDLKEGTGNNLELKGSIQKNKKMHKKGHLEL